MKEAIVHTKYNRNARIAMANGGERSPRSREVGVLKWVYHPRSEHTPPKENPPTTFHGREGQKETLFSKMIRHVLVMVAQILRKQLSSVGQG